MTKKDRERRGVTFDGGAGPCIINNFIRHAGVADSSHLKLDHTLECSDRIFWTESLFSRLPFEPWDCSRAVGIIAPLIQYFKQRVIMLFTFSPVNSDSVSPSLLCYPGIPRIRNSLEISACDLIILDVIHVITLNQKQHPTSNSPKSMFFLRLHLDKDPHVVYCTSKRIDLQ